MRTFLDERPDVAWLEIHSETFLADGGPRSRALEQVRRDYPISCHSVGLSLGSAGGVDPAHLRRLRVLYDRIEPWIVSDHLAWCGHGETYLNDLLPLPCTEESLAVVTDNVDRAQEALGRRLLVENPSLYGVAPGQTMTETDFLADLARKTGCGLLLDVNNVHVSAANIGFDPWDYLDAFPFHAVGEIHVAGHARRVVGGETLLIDDHGSRVGPEVSELLARLLTRHGPWPVLVEWDNAVPDLAVLLDEAARMQAMIDRAGPRPAGARSLEAFQADMAAALLGRGGAGSPFGPDDPGAHRFSVYRDNVALSLARAIESAFPATLARMGEARFRSAAREFVLTFPPTRPQLSAYGGGFPAFVEEAGGEAGVLAAFEWMRQVCYFAAAATPLPLDGLHGVAPEDYPRLRFTPHPALRLRRFPIDVIGLWEACLDNRPEAEATSGPVAVMARRVGDAVACHVLTDAEAALLEALIDRQPVALAAEAATALDAEFDLSRVLGWHLGNQTFRDFDLHPTMVPS